MGSKRDRYRVEQRERFLAVLLRTAAGGVAEGQVEDLSAGGCGAVFDGREAPVLEDGAQVELLFRALVVPDAIRVEAVVRRRAEERGKRRYGFEFADPQKVLAQVPYVLRREFNRRALPRLRLDAAVEVGILAQPERKGLPARMLDLSAGGLGLRIASSLAGLVGTGEGMEFRFRLPDCAFEFRFAGTVRERRAVGADVVYHVQFDPARTPSAAAQRSALEDYLAPRVGNDPHVREP